MDNQSRLVRSRRRLTSDGTACRISLECGAERMTAELTVQPAGRE